MADCGKDWCDFHTPCEKCRPGVEARLKASGGKPTIEDTWAVLKKMVSEGLVETVIKDGKPAFVLTEKGKAEAEARGLTGFEEGQ